MPPEADPRKQAGPQVIEFGRNEGTGEKDQPVKQGGILYHAYCATSLQSCPILCNPMDCSPPGSSVHGILQARILEWVAMPFSRDLLDSGIKPMPCFLHWQVNSLPLVPPAEPWNPI